MSTCSIASRPARFRFGIRMSILCIITLATPTLSPAQNWESLNRHWQYNYKLPGDTYISRCLKADSFSITGADTLFYLGMQVAPGPQVQGYSSYLSDSPCVLKRNVIRKPNAVWAFCDPDTIWINAHAGMGEAWLYNSVSGDSAKVMSLALDSVFGQTDSVKLIVSDNGDSIRLSRSFGIIEVPHPLDFGQLKLVGINGPDLGHCLPKWQHFFPYDSGDVFQYDYYSWHMQVYPVYCYFDIKVRYLSVSNYTDSIVCRVEVRKKGVDGLMWSYPFASTDTLTWVFSPESYSVASSLPGKLYHSRRLNLRTLQYDLFVFPDSVYSVSAATVSDSGNVVKNLRYCNQSTKCRELMPVNPSLPNTLPNQYIPDTILPNWIYDEVYEVDLGIVSAYYTGFEQYGHVRLEAYFKDGTTVGTLLPDSHFILTVEEAAKAELRFEVFPNPCQGEVSVHFEDDFNGTIEVMTISGYRIAIEKLSGRSTDFSGLPQGMLLIRCINDNGQSVRKLLVR
jgi:hypothetical protein